jgi:hypothetical protein
MTDQTIFLLLFLGTRLIDSLFDLAAVLGSSSQDPAELQKRRTENHRVLNDLAKQLNLPIPYPEDEPKEPPNDS